MGDLTLQQIIMRVFAVGLIASAHGFAIAATSCAMGDCGPRLDERLKLNPLRHLDPVGGLLAVLFGVGWIRPMAVDPRRMRLGRAGLLAVVTSAACATIAIAVLLHAVRPFLLNQLPDTASAACFIFIETVGRLCVLFTIFNLLPLPPLTGFHLLRAALPRIDPALSRTQPYFVVLLALLVASGSVTRLLASAESALERLVFAS